MSRMKSVAGVLFAVGCSTAPDPAAPVGSPPAVASASLDPLFANPVTAAKFARRELYTWTTTEQIEELRTTHVLLSREDSPTYGASGFEKTIYALAEKGDRTAAMLDSTGFAKSRFAWPAPWATRAGMPGEDYGDQLIKIRLRDDAIVLMLDAQTGKFTAHDLADREIPVETVAPEKIGAIYYVTPEYREYVVPNESMIAAWSVGTDDIYAEIAREATALDALRPTHGVGYEAQWAASLALFARTYTLHDESLLHGLADQLRATPRPKAIEGAGQAKFLGATVRRPPPRVVKRVNTYTTY